VGSEGWQSFDSREIAEISQLRGGSEVNICLAHVMVRD